MTRQRLWIGALTLVVLAGCASVPPVDKAPEKVEPLQVQVLRGEMTTTSPDGTVPYGPAEQVVAKRTADPASGTIVEETWHGDEHHVTTLTRRAGSGVFDVSDGGATFAGTVTYTGPDWAWTAWTYDIAMTDGSGSITGDGHWEGERYLTDKLFVTPDGEARARIREALSVVPPEQAAAALPH